MLLKFCAMPSEFFPQPPAVSVETTDDLVISACVLHNLLRAQTEGHITVDSNIDSLLTPTENFIPLAPTNQRHGSHEAERVRTIFKNYFSTQIGTVPWQMGKVRRLTL